MKKLILSFLTFPFILFAQYRFDGSTEQNFETSDFYFSRYFMNPFGMQDFKEITPGLIDNPFLNISINPARITQLENRFYTYIDYRGERTTYNPGFFDYPVPFDIRIKQDIYPERVLPFYISQARVEPEPKFSIGVIGSPFNSLKDQFFVGAYFQRIQKAEKFYSMPYWIYYPIYGHDPFGNRYAEIGSYPIVDRYSGKDEMLTEANLYSFFTGYKLNENLSIGFQFSGINHSRNGGYRDKYNDDYGNIDNQISLRDYLIERTRNYKHTDYTLGLTYTEKSTQFGIKLGILKGNADQSLLNINKSFNQINVPNVSPSWSIIFNDYITNQSWNNSGNLYYSGFDFNHSFSEDIKLIGYFNYFKGKIEFENFSSINDTSLYSGKYIYNSNQNFWLKYKNSYSLIDNRKGSGYKNKSNYSGLIALKWKITPALNVTFGLAYFENNLEIKSNEPVIFNSVSFSELSTNDSANYNYPSKRVYLRFYEDKTIEWNYNSINFSYQIPVVFDFRFSEKIEATILLNQISGGTKVNQYTDAIIKTRIRTENDSTKQFNNFIERFSDPSVNRTFEKTELIARIKFNLNQNLGFAFTFDPELTPFINFAQWWFNIEAKF